MLVGLGFILIILIILIVLLVLGTIQIVIGGVGLKLSGKKGFILLIVTGILFLFPVGWYVYGMAEQSYNSYPPLFKAIKYQDLESLKENINNENINKIEPLGIFGIAHTPLSFCCEEAMDGDFGEMEPFIRYLLEQGANPNNKGSINSSNYFGLYPVTVAVESGNIRFVALLLEYGADINIGVTTPLDYALDLNDYAMVKFLLGHGAKEGASLSEDEFPSLPTGIMDAVSDQDYNMLNLLLEYGGDINLGTEESTPLKLAVEMNDFKMIQFLFDHEAIERISLNNDEFANEPTFLMNAISQNNIEMCELLLVNGADISVRTEDESPFSLAIKGGDLKMVKWVVALGAAVEDNSSILELALLSSGVEILTYLSSVGHSPYLFARDDLGNNALHIAAKEENILMVEYLLSKGFSPNSLNKEGETPLFVVVTEAYMTNDDFLEKKALVKLLIKSGADPTLQNRNKEDCFKYRNKSPETFHRKLLDYIGTLRE